MKLIHTGDIHLGAAMDSVYPPEIASVRKEELRGTFRRMVEYAHENGVEGILLCGDVFDSDTPFKRDRDFFYSVVRAEPEIDFYYLRGNHDRAGGTEVLPNLKTFSSAWTCYRRGNVVICGIECTDENALSRYATLSLRREDVNLVMMHGQIGENTARDTVCLKRLRGKNIDYLALGHIHKRGEGVLDDRGSYCYCGCLEGRGFDEVGIHGFELLDIGNTVTRTFVPFAQRTVEEIDADVSGAENSYEAFRRVMAAASFEKPNIYRVNLTGEVGYDTESLAGDVRQYLSGKCLFADVKDRTRRKLDFASFEKDTSLKGEFVRCVLNNSEYTEDEKARILSIGLRALRGEKIDL